MAYNPNMYMPQYSGYSQNWMYTPSTTQPVNGLVSVTGIEGAKAYQLPPNSSMPLFDGNSDLMYVKTTDAAGYPTIRTFRFEPVEQDPAPQADYVSRSDFDALVARVEELAAPKTRSTRKAVQDAE